MGKDIRGELMVLLSEAWELEHAYEFKALKEAKKYCESPEVVDLVDLLASESIDHKAMIDAMFKMIGANHEHIVRGKGINFNFDRAWDAEIIEELVWIEKKIVRFYHEALLMVQDEDNAQVIPQNERDPLKKILQYLEEEEYRHLHWNQGLLMNYLINEDSAKGQGPQRHGMIHSS